MQPALTGPARLADVMHRFAQDAAIPELLPVVAGLREQPTATDAADEYLTIRHALARAASVSADRGDERVDAWLAGQTVVLTTMAAAVAVVEAAGLTVDRRTDMRSHLDRARRWQAYSAGPVTELHRRCGQDISRGSVRLFGLCRAVGEGSSADRRLELQRLRLQLVADGRARCTQFRRDLQEMRGVADTGVVERHVRAGLARLLARAQEQWSAGLAELAGAAIPAVVAPWPMPDVPGPPVGPHPDEQRLSAVLGAGFGLGVALAAVRLVSGLTGLTGAGAVACGAVVGLVLGGWVVAVRGRLQRRAVLDRWAADAITAVRLATEDEVARRCLEIQQQLVRLAAERPPAAHHKSRNCGRTANGTATTDE